MWKVMAPATCLFMVLPAHSKMAGGMVHWTNEGVDLSPDGIMRYIAGSGDADSIAILKKEKEYYAACVNKTLSRLALARSRIDAADLTTEERSILDERLESGVEWLASNKKALLSANDRESFEKAVDLKTWHAVKMLPTATEGYAIACSIEKRLGRMSESRDKSRAVKLNDQARSTFWQLLNLDGSADFVAREKDRIEAFGRLSKADNWLKKIGAEDQQA